MSQENVEIVREVMALAEAARNCDASELDDVVERLLGRLAADGHIDMSQRVFNPQIYEGHAGIRRFLHEIREVWDEFQVTPERFIDAGDSVVVIETIRGRGRASGLEVENRSAAVWTLRDGQVLSLRTTYDLQEALKAVGLEDG